VDIACYWHIPLGLLVCFWIANGRGLKFRTRDYWFALGVAVITGLQNVYYTNAFIQLVGISLIIQWMKRGWSQWRAVVPAFSIGVAAFVTFFLMVFRAPLYSLLHGHSSGAAVRTYAQMEFYGLKLIDLFIPFPTHKFPPFAALGARYESWTSLPAEVPPACYFGLVGLAAFIWLAVTTVRRAISRPARSMPTEAVQVLWIIIYATVGGANAFIGVMKFQLFRSTTRFCIVILAITLLFAARRLTLIARRWHAPWPLLAPALLAIFGLWEFLPPSAGEPIRYVAALTSSDRDFSVQMEQMLPKGAMVFQLPVQDFPETPIVGMSAYDHFRPYIYTSNLRFSFGDDKGRAQNAWQRVIVGLPPAEQITTLEKYGFSAIYINRAGFPSDHAQGLINQYRAAGRTEIYESAQKDLVWVRLHPSPTPELPQPGPFFSDGWYSEQDEPNGQRAHFASGNAYVTLTNPGTEPVAKYARFYIASMAPRLVSVQGAGAIQSWHVDQQRPARVANLRLTLPPGQTKVLFSTDTPATPSQLGMVTFYVVNFDLSDSPLPEQ
jgi:hypothetical protein